MAGGRLPLGTTALSLCPSKGGATDADGVDTPDRSHGSMIWSARPGTACGIVRPSALAVFRLIANSNFVGCPTGRAACLAPLRILSTYAAARGNGSGVFAHQREESAVTSLVEPARAPDLTPKRQRLLELGLDRRPRPPP